MEAKPKKTPNKYQSYKEYYKKAIEWYKFKLQFSKTMEQEENDRDKDLLDYYRTMLKEMERYEKNKPENPNWEDWCDWRWK